MGGTWRGTRSTILATQTASPPAKGPTTRTLGTVSARASASSRPGTRPSTGTDKPGTSNKPVSMAPAAESGRVPAASESASRRPRSSAARSAAARVVSVRGGRGNRHARKRSCVFLAYSSAWARKCAAHSAAVASGSSDMSRASSGRYWKLT